MAMIIRSFVVASVLGALLVPRVDAQWPALPVSPIPVQRYEYDATGNLTRVTQVTPSGSGPSTQHFYDPLSRRTQTIDALGGVLRSSHTARDDISAIVDPIGARTSYERDGFGSVVALRSPDTGTTSHSYDAAGRLTVRTDARGVVSAYSYDALGRLIAASHGRAGVDTQVLRWNYDEALGGSTFGVGYLTSMSGPATLAQFFRDVQGRVIRHVQRTTVTTTSGSTAIDDLSVDYAYDAGGQLVRLKMPSGRVVYLSRSAGQVQSIAVAPNETSTAATIMSQIRYEPYGPVGGWLWHTTGGTRAHDRIFDAAGRMIRHPLGTLIRDIRYDPAGHIQSYVHFVAATGAGDPAWDQTFVHDGVGRLSGVGWRYYYRAFAMDANGNRRSFVKDGVFGSYTMQPASNRMLSAPFPNRNYGYDAAGNPTVLGLPASEIYPSGQLAYLATPYGTGRYTYDAMGRRVIKVAQTGEAGAPSIATLYVYDPEHRLLGEYAAGGGVPLREYVWLDDIPVAMLETDPTSPAGMPRIYFVHADHLNTPRVLMDRSDAVRWRWIDEPFGSELPQENPSGLGSVTFNLRMPGQVFDAESRLHYNFHRYYDPSTGRYTQSDPVGLAGGINTYAYVGLAPTTYVDPIGLWSTSGHNDILFAFAAQNGLTVEQLQAMMAGSAAADAGKYQDDEHTFMHAMSSSELSKRQACELARDFVRGKIDRAKEDIGRFPGLLGPYWQLGFGLHAVMDSTSPAHEGFAFWTRWVTPIHGPFWTSIEDKPSPAQIAATVRRMVDAMSGRFNFNCECY